MAFAPPAARQGPGRLSEPAVRAVDVAIARRIEGTMAGEHRAAGLGAGTEIAQLRPYEIGDDVRLLDPAATARTGEPYVRQHVPERALTTWLVVDAGASMAWGTHTRLKADVADGVARVVTRMALRRAGRVGMITFGGGAQQIVAPRGGKRAMVGIRRALDAGNAPDGAGDPFGLERSLRRLGRLAPRAGLVVVVSDFRHAEHWERPLKALSRRHAVVCVEVFDPRERELPDAGTTVLVDPETGRQLTVDLSSRDLRDRFARAERERTLRVATAVRRAGASLVTVSAGEDWLRGLGLGLARRRGAGA